MKKKLISILSSISELNNLLIVLSIITGITVAVSIITVHIIPNLIISIISIVLGIIEVCILSFVLLVLINNMAKNMIDEYSKKKSLFSGALCILLVSVTTFLLLTNVSNLIYKDQPNNISTIAGTIIALTPALLSLLGVHYSNMMQEVHRQEDFIIANTPCLLVKCNIERIYHNELIENGFYINIKIINLLDNICIPLCVCDNELPYIPVTKSNVDGVEFNNIKISYNNYKSENISLLYEDISGNLYVTKLELDISKEYHYGEYEIIKNTKPILLKIGTKLLKENMVCPKQIASNPDNYI